MGAGGDARAWAVQGRRGGQRLAHAASGPGPGRRAQSPFGQFADPRPAPRCRERSGSTGNIFAPCMISGPSTRKGALDGKIRAPCIPNHPIVPGNGRIGRGSCHLDLEKHAFRADIAREGAFFAHSAKNGCIRRNSCQPGPRCRRNARDGDTGGVRWARCGWGSASAGRGTVPKPRGTRERGPNGLVRRSGRGKRMDTVQERGARWTRCARTGGGYSPKCASIAATRSFRASISRWFTSSIFCKSAGEALST